MIVHKVPRKKRRQSNRSVRAHAARLGIYIFDARAADDQKLSLHEDQRYVRSLAGYAAAPEKVLATRAKNFRSEGFGDQLAQMDELLSNVGSNTDKLDHWVLSWDATDNPTIDEMFDAFDIFNRCLRIESCPSLIGLHGNTKNRHGHQAVLRVDPNTCKAIDRPFDGWDIDAAHRAMAVIEDRYPHWKINSKSLYQVRYGRLIHRDTATDVGAATDPDSWIPLIRRNSSSAAASDKKLLAKIDAASMRFEDDTGWKSRTRIALEEAVPALLRAKDWADAHGQLAKLGLGLELAQNKSGANFIINGKKVKASVADETALAKLQKRWGAFQPRPDHTGVATYLPRPMFPGDAERTRYYAAKRAFIAGLTQMVAEVRSAEKGYRSSVPSSDCDPSKLTRLSYPTFEDWRAGAPTPDVAQVLGGSSQVAGFGGETLAHPIAYNIKGYEAHATRKGIAYRKIGEIYARPPVFDVGLRVYVNDGTDASIRIALRIMQTRNPGRPLKPFGPPEFIARVQKIAEAEKILVASVAMTVEAKASDQDNPMANDHVAGATGPGQEGMSAPADKLPDATTPETSTPLMQQSSDPRSSDQSAAAEKDDARGPAKEFDAADEFTAKTRKQERSPDKADPRVEAAKAAAAALAARWGRD